MVMLTGLLLIAATDKNNEKPVKFDFKKTSALTHEIDSRPDFPVSLLLARDYVYSVLALGETMDPKLKQKTIDYVKNLQRLDGGFSVDFPTPDTSSQNTDFALEVLSYLDAVNAVNTGKVKSYLSTLKEPDGGFRFDSKTKGSSFSATYNAVHALSYINGLDLVDKAKTAAYIKEFEKKDTGGFNYVKGTGPANVTNTYMAVFMLKAIGLLDDETKTKAIKYLMTTPYLGKPVVYTINHTLQDQTYVIITLKMLGAEKKINKAGVVEFIKGFYIEPNGGFSPIQGYGSAPDPTYFGIQGLAELGVLKRPQ